MDLAENIDALFLRNKDALLVIENEYFVKANKRALELLDISSVDVMKALHPAKISPEYQPDGESSKLKANHMFSRLAKEGYIQFDWQHITIHGNPFDVQVSLRLREENNRIFIDVHWYEY